MVLYEESIRMATMTKTK